MEPTILVAEDDEHDVFIMQRVFRETGTAMRLQTVRDGDEAINYLAGNAAFADRSIFPLPALLFLDLKMPGKNGFEVLEWKRTRRDLQIPAVILSSSPEEGDMRRARELGASCYLIKPPTKSLLLACFKQFGLPPVE